ncbi:MAG: 3-deoxy-7-phosphoheptulonate synthase, partial [Ignavibacteriaceae bacterium]
MIVVLEKNITEKQLNNIIKHLEDFGFAIHKSAGEEKVIIGAIGVQPNFDTRKVKILEGVEEVYRITDPFKLASRSFKKDDTIFKIKDVEIGGNEVSVIAGPCSVESEEQIMII